MKRWGQQTNGFTIVELVFVIVIIVIIVLISVASYRAVVNESTNTALKTELTKISDQIKLKALDDGFIPNGGATSSNTGDSTILTGVQVRPEEEFYDTSISNLYYCAGDVNGNREYAVVAQAASGTAFVNRSNGGISELTEYTLGVSNTGVALCTALGFATPFTWSYGYNPNPSIGWFTWANSGSATVSNLVLNPIGQGSTAGWFSPIVANVTATSNVSWNGRTNWYRYVWNGTGASTVRLNLNLADLTNGRSYTSSILVGNPGTVTINWSMDFADVGITNFSLAPGESRRVYFTASRATYDSTFRFLDFNLNSSASTGLLVSQAMVTEGTTRYDYADGATAGWTWNGTAYNSTSTGTIRPYPQ